MFLSLKSYKIEIEFSEMGQVMLPFSSTDLPKLTKKLKAIFSIFYSSFLTKKQVVFWAKQNYQCKWKFHRIQVDQNVPKENLKFAIF